MLNFGAVALSTSSADHPHSVADSTCDKRGQVHNQLPPLFGEHNQISAARLATIFNTFRAISPLFAQLHTIRTSTLLHQTFPSEKALGKKEPLRWWFRANLVPTAEPWWLTRETQVQRPATWPGPPALWLCQKDATSLQKSTVLQRFHIAGHRGEAGGAALLFNKDTFKALPRTKTST